MRKQIRNIFSSTPDAADRQRGSALLIVLGFLSFMMISAVSFAVYMRIERQSSSNYRHSVSARHLLNAALYRAIDEIDSELRIPKVNDEAVDRPRKFPNWPGRVKTSAVANGEENARDARVLTLEALSFIPGILVNDVRRYAIPSDTDPGYNASDPTDNWRGAKWRRLSMPVSAIRGEAETAVRSEVGRYAYICVNVSDMLDVNLCKAAVRDSGTNRVSIGHLFQTPAQREAFDTKFKETDRHYGSLQDFYACMYQRRRDSMPSTISNPMADTPFGSAYHSFIREQDDEFFDEATRHILITDSVSMAQPTAGEPCNVLLNFPVSAALLGQPQATAVILDAEKFAPALNKVFKNRLPSGADASGMLMATAIADYIDADSIPKRLNMPTAEMVPMVSQILVPNAIGPTVGVRNAPDWTEAKPTRVYFLNLVGENPGLAQVDVELVWPFKNHQDRMVRPTFTVEVEAYVTPIKQHEPKNSKNVPQSKGDYVRLTGTLTAPDFWNVDTSTDPNKCYQKATVKLAADNPAALAVDMVHSENGAMNGFAEGTPASVAMVVFVNVRQGGASGPIVDRVPQASAYPGSGELQADEEFGLISKLYFQTQPTAPINKTMAVDNKPIAYAWNSLEVPDARFNHKASNWQTVSAGNAITPALNPSATALLGQKGRDGDIYLFVSDAGKMYSPGELGFIIRPCPFKTITPGAPVDFHGTTEIEDKDYMFRTVRLYDHGQPSSATDVERARDPVYDYFTAADASGKVVGSRVNPLSDIRLVLQSAVERTPVNYWYANFGSAAQLELNNFNTVLQDPGTLNDTSSDWYKFKSGWYLCLTNASPKLNITWQKNLSDFYGNWDTFGWYSDGNPTTIFDTANHVNGAETTLNSAKLYEIDRKMLMSYTLESFSDRQQLFLYIIRAEATATAFGNSIGGPGETETKSLAGGSAVALVWRDPYPDGYDKENDNWTAKGTKKWYSKINRVSPWYQHNKKANNGGKYDDSRDEQSDGSEANDDLIDGERLDGYHPHRILFFKQLDK
ncbi:MAG TPA: hypothetical protein PKM57_10760 [Kiritimatiellia bacterium]|nr:hypothetical protein [Kiritimatiellia bacterium]HPS06341.1 hypothetical protein [Kiritimatiellia bacterium]